MVTGVLTTTRVPLPVVEKLPMPEQEINKNHLRSCLHNASCRKLNPGRQPEIKPSVTKPAFSAPRLRQDTTTTLIFIRKVCHWCCMSRVARRTEGCRLDISTGISLFVSAGIEFRAPIWWHIRLQRCSMYGWRLLHGTSIPDWTIALSGGSPIVSSFPQHAGLQAAASVMRRSLRFTQNHNSKFWQYRAYYDDTTLSVTHNDIIWIHVGYHFQL